VGIPINEVIRDVESPLTEKMLRPPHPRCQRIQFRSRLSDPDFRTLADWLQEYPWVALRAYDDYLDDLEFLRFFPTIRQFMADGLDLTSFYGLQYLPGELSHLSLGQTRKRLSLAPIGRFTSLRRLFLEGHTRDIDVVQQLRHLSSLTLRSITLTDLSYSSRFVSCGHWTSSLAEPTTSPYYRAWGRCGTWNCGVCVACMTSARSG
jgi:hypothetical protein